MLVQDPHDLCCVHCGAAADGNDHIGLEGSHLGGTGTGAGQSGIGLDGMEGVVDDAQLIQLLLDGTGVAVLVQEGIGDDECLLVLLQLVQSHGQAALLEVDLFRCAEPQHVFSPLSHGLDVQQVLDAHVLGNGVAAPGAAAQSQGGGHLEVVQVADAAVGGGSVDDDTAGLHAVCESVQLGTGGDGVNVQGSGVADAAVTDQGVCLVQSILEGGSAVHSQNRGQLLVSELLADVGGLDLADEDLGGLGDLHASQSGDGVGGLADDLGVQSAVDDDGLTDLLALILVQDVAATGQELGTDSLVDVVHDDDALLGSADHAVVEGLGVNDGGNGQLDVSGRIDDSGDVACADAQSGLAGGVSSLDHAGAAGGQDQVGLLHDVVGHLQRGLVDPEDDAFGCAGCNSCLGNDLSCLHGALLCTGVGGDHDAVTGLQADQSLEDCSGSGVGGGDDSADQADGLSDTLNAVGRVVLDNTTGLGVLVGVVDVLGSVVVLDDLVFHDAHAGLLDGHLGKFDTGFVSGGGSSQEDLVDLLLGVGGELGLSSAAALEGFVQFVHVGNGHVVRHSVSPFLDSILLYRNISIDIIALITKIVNRNY